MVDDGRSMPACPVMTYLADSNCSRKKWMEKNKIE